MKLFGISMGALLLASLALAAAPATAADYEFDAELQGEGTLDWDLAYEETEDWTVNAGAEYSFGGGAGTDGEAIAKGDFTGVGGYFYETAGGDGTAYSHTNGANAAEANFGSESYAANGGFAANLEFGDPAKISHSGVVTAGGAGSAETGLTYGTNYAYGNTGTLTYDVDADLHFEYDETP